jgi:AcrR family transcriptional regulator
VTAARRTQEERRAEAEQRLLTAAAELIGEVGPGGVTLATIGERAGYSRGLATHHFGSKGALMQRLVDTVGVEFRDEVFAETASDAVLDQALGLVRAYFAELSDPRPANRARLVLWADAVASPAPETRAAIRASDRQFREELAKCIRRGLDNGEIAGAIEPDAIATAIIGMLRGVALQHILDDDIDLGSCRLEVERLLKRRLQA